MPMGWTTQGLKPGLLGPPTGMKGSVSPGPGHCPWAIFITDFSEFAGGDIQRFLLGNALPFTFTSFPNSFNRVENPIRVIEKLCNTQAFRTKGSLIDRMVRVSFNFNDPAVFHMGQNATGTVAT
jgi:hypothetical protein